LLALPVGVLAWRPIADPAPDRWGHALIMLAVAELGESRLDPAIDALDMARALSPGSASRVVEITAEGPVHDRLVALIRESINSGVKGRTITQIQKVRWLRQVPEGRREARKLLDTMLQVNPDDSPVLRESAAWFLGESAAPEPRRRAVEGLALACREPVGDAEAFLLRGLLEGRADFLWRLDSLDLRMARRISLACSILRMKKNS
jgi:hypothetical protein